MLAGSSRASGWRETPPESSPRTRLNFTPRTAPGLQTEKPIKLRTQITVTTTVLKTDTRHDQLPGYLGEVIEGLSAPEKTLPCKLFYDERGSGLFDRICELDEYYVTRTENALMAEHAAEMADAIGPGCLLIEYGAGSSKKIRALLDHLKEPAAFVPIDISGEHLVRSTDVLKKSYPDVEIRPVVADFTASFTVPAPSIKPSRSVVYFPGSTIGNFTPEEATDLLHGMAERVGRGGGLLIGVDLVKDPGILHAAYNDREGVTASFNLNLLVRLNREVGANFNLSCFTHRASYNTEKARIEMRLHSDRRQSVEIAGHRFDFEIGESILTEYSHKYTVDSFGKIAMTAGFRPRGVWTDDDDLFSVQYLELD